MHESLSRSAFNLGYCCAVTYSFESQMLPSLLCAISLLLISLTISVEFNRILPIECNVVFTTIPQRIESIHYTLASWIKQEDALVHIFVVIPTSTSFSLANSSQQTSYECKVLSRVRKGLMNLGLTFADVSCGGPIVLSSATVTFVTLPTEYGPVTKYAGLSFLATSQDLITSKRSDFWIVSDDDVYYDSQIVKLYGLKLTGIPKQFWGDIVATGFAPSTRLEIQSNVKPDVQDEYSSRVEKVKHIQGVDTVMIPSVLVANSVAQRTLFHYNVLSTILTYVHVVCPDTYFQDDYVISLLLHISNIDIVSIWSPSYQLVHHVEGVSKSNDQMHMNSEVHDREDKSRRCLALYANRLRDILAICKMSEFVCERFQASLVKKVL